MTSTEDAQAEPREDIEEMTQLADVDDLTHYMQATSRLSAENKRLTRDLEAAQEKAEHWQKAYDFQTDQYEKNRVELEAAQREIKELRMVCDSDEFDVFERLRKQDRAELEAARQQIEDLDKSWLETANVVKVECDDARARLAAAGELAAAVRVYTAPSAQRPVLIDIADAFHAMRDALRAFDAATVGPAEPCHGVAQQWCDIHGQVSWTHVNCDEIHDSAVERDDCQKDIDAATVGQEQP
jgi:hypothetical protein